MLCKKCKSNKIIKNGQQAAVFMQRTNGVEGGVKSRGLKALPFRHC